ncbi:methyltransferase domain-containing protein [archaeon]|nr:MAG: methyltransferase domain-containing protein [archaeon]
MGKQNKHKSKAHQGQDRVNSARFRGESSKQGKPGNNHHNKPSTVNTNKSKTHKNDMPSNKPAARQSNSQPEQVTHVSTSKPDAGGGSTMSNTTGLSALQQQFAKKLEGARFRVINEDLYTNPGHASFEDFQLHPEKFTIYHSGYREQAAQWPINPLDLIIHWIQRHHSSAVVADMGCGEARLAASVRNTVHSFDLVAANASVTACDIAHVPLFNNTVDIVVFCLSLMGTNLVDFVKEAHRILKVGGLLKVAEVRSRFQDNKGMTTNLCYLSIVYNFVSA